MPLIIGRKASSPSWHVAYARDNDGRLMWRGRPMLSRTSAERDLHNAPEGLRTGVYCITENPEQFGDECFNLILGSESHA